MDSNECGRRVAVAEGKLFFPHLSGRTYENYGTSIILVPPEMRI
jgi:hypothetical protein